MIKILLDQNIPAETEAWLARMVGDRATVDSTRSLGMQRMSDEDIFYYCQKNRMVLITYDDDFQNPLVIPDVPGYGVIRLNIYPTGLLQTQDALSRLLVTHPLETWEKASIVIDQKKIRYSKK